MLVTDNSRKQVFVLVLPSFNLSFDYFCLAPRTPKNFIHQYVFLTHSSSSVDVPVVYQCDKLSHLEGPKRFTVEAFP